MSASLVISVNDDDDDYKIIEISLEEALQKEEKKKISLLTL
tara:strand:+ start:103 stop:225 length:123 start_codon:yes stop_codon:yes gene_type:complete